MLQKVPAPEADLEAKKKPMAEPPPFLKMPTASSDKAVLVSLRTTPQRRASGKDVGPDYAKSHTQVEAPHPDKRGTNNEKDNEEEKEVELHKKHGEPPIAKAQSSQRQKEESDEDDENDKDMTPRLENPVTLGFRPRHDAFVDFAEIPNEKSQDEAMDVPSARHFLRPQARRAASTSAVLTVQNRLKQRVQGKANE